MKTGILDHFSELMLINWLGGKRKLDFQTLLRQRWRNLPCCYGKYRNPQKTNRTLRLLSTWHGNLPPDGTNNLPKWSPLAPKHTGAELGLIHGPANMKYIALCYGGISFQHNCLRSQLTIVKLNKRKCTCSYTYFISLNYRHRIAIYSMDNLKTKKKQKQKENIRKKYK